MRGNLPPFSDPAERRRAMGAFALADASLLAKCAEAIGVDEATASPVRGPEIGLVMLRGRIGGGGSPFNLGEASVTRASVRLTSGEIGHALVLGRDPVKARLAAALDAFWQRPDWRERIEAEIVAPMLAQSAEEDRRLAEETEATRVEFFTLVRGED